MADQKLMGLVSAQSAAGKTEEEIGAKLISQGYTAEDVHGALAVLAIQKSGMGIRPAIAISPSVQNKRYGANTFLQFVLILVLMASAPAVYGLATKVVIPTLKGQAVKTNGIADSYDLLKDIPANEKSLASNIPNSPWGIVPMIEVSNSAPRDSVGSSGSRSSGSVSATHSSPAQTGTTNNVAVAAPTVTATVNTNTRNGNPVTFEVVDQSPGVSAPVVTPPVVTPPVVTPPVVTPPVVTPPVVTPPVVTPPVVTPPVVTPPVVTPPPPVGNYPAAVATAGLQNVWDLRNTAGLQSTPTHTPANTPLPVGTATTTFGSQTALIISQSADFTGWDFTGWRVIVFAPVTVTFTNSKFSNSGGYSVLDVGVNDNNPSAINTPTVTCSHCEFDLHGIIEFYEAPIRIGTAGNFTLQDSYIHDPARDEMTVSTSGNLTVTRDYFTSPGLNSQVGDHLEVIHLYQGNPVISQNLFDMSNGAGRILGGWTGVVYPEAYSGNLVANIDKNIFVGSKAVNLLYVMQQGNRNGEALTVNVANNVFELGSNGVVMGRSGGLLNQTGNYDFTTGLPIPDITAGSPLAAAITANISGLEQLLANLLAELRHLVGM